MSLLWVDKYRPKDLQKLTLHKELNLKLKGLSEEDDLPHLIFYGPPSSGKKTRSMLLLKEIFGAGVERIRKEEMTFTTPSNKKIQVNVTSSNFHVEINPSSAGIYDRVVIMDLIKNIAQTQQLDVNNDKTFKVILIRQADELTKDAQHALRRTMEKYIANCRVILLASSLSRLSSAVKSRCLAIRVPAATVEEIVDILQTVAKKENFNLTDGFAKKIAEESNKNLRRAILMLEVAKVERSALQNNQTEQEIPKFDWVLVINELSQIVLSKQDIEAFEKIGEYLQELLENGIPSTVIMRHMLINFLNDIQDTHLQARIVELASYYEHKSVHTNKEIFHLEAFVAQVMLAYQEFMKNMISDFMLE